MKLNNIGKGFTFVLATLATVKGTSGQPIKRALLNPATSITAGRQLGQDTFTCKSEALTASLLPFPSIEPLLDPKNKNNLLKTDAELPKDCDVATRNKIQPLFNDPTVNHVDKLSIQSDYPYSSQDNVKYGERTSISKNNGCVETQTVLTYTNGTQRTKNTSTCTPVKKSLIKRETSLLNALWLKLAPH